MINENVFGEDKLTGQVLNVHEVPNGNACGCICIKCRSDLQSRQGEERAWHFKHLSGIECNPETILHLLAKRILTEHDFINLPSDKGRFEYDKVLVEYSLGNFRPDILLIGKQSNICVEIAVTHFIEEAKYRKILAADVNTLEINLSQLDRKLQYPDLKTIIVDSIESKEIIHWRYKKNQANNDDNAFWIWFWGIILVVSGWFMYRRYKRKRKRLHPGSRQFHLFSF